MRFVTRAFLRVARATGGMSLLFHYFAASTLKRAELQDGIRQAWQGFNSQQADISAGLRPWEADFVQRFIQPGAVVLLAGCGSGRDMLPLLERGCRLTGIDPASRALDLARRVLEERKLSATLIEGFIEDVRLSGQFDTAMFSFDSYSYIPESARRIGALREVAAHLNPGGRVIVSYQPLLRPHQFMIRLARIVGRLSGSDWRLEPGDYVSRKRFLDRDYYSYIHAFLPDELEQEAAAAGLAVVYRLDSSDQAAVAFEARSGATFTAPVERRAPRAT